MKRSLMAFGFLSFFSAAALADDAVVVTEYNGKKYEEARIAILDAGWKPVLPKREPEDGSMVRKYKKLGFSELDWCSVDTCVFRFEREKELLGVMVFFDKYGTDWDSVQNSYLRMKDGSDPVVATPQLQPKVAPQVQVTAAMSDAECLKVVANIFYYLSTAGVKQHDANFKPLHTLIKNGSFTFQGASVKDGECYQSILVDGVYFGTSYRQKLTGVAKSF